MKKRLSNFNWRTAILVFMLCQVVLYAAACGATITQISDMLPSIGTLLSAILAFVTGLGSSVSANVVSAANTVNTDAQAALTEAEAEIKVWTQSTSTTVLGKVSDLLGGIQSTLNTFLKGLSISNPASQTKLQEIISLAITAVEGVIALIPVLSTKLTSASLHDLAHLDKTTAATLKGLHNGLKESYAGWRNTPTGDAETDSALSKTPISI